MHQPYEQKLNHKADFRVTYIFYTEAEGGRKMLPYQGIRSDFWYEDPDNVENRIYMIWPEFEDEAGNLILENDRLVKKEGTARMWIINAKVRNFHKERIKIGTKGYFKEGPKSIAACEVIEILELYNNPTQ